jgi:apolipoprotein N-acyltransferase
MRSTSGIRSIKACVKAFFVKKTTIMQRRINWNFAFLVLASILGIALLSPRWAFPPAAFAAPAILLWLIRNRKPWRSFLLSAGVLIAGNLIANYKVMPFPILLFIPITIQISLLATLPYLCYELIRRQSHSWLATLIFPLLQVLLEYGNSFLGGGTWGSIAYSQINNAPLVQVSSLTGMWGITFLIYWFSSIVTYGFEHRWSWSAVRVPVTLYSGLILVTMMFGLLRIHSAVDPSEEVVRVAGISGSNYHMLGIIYEDAFGKKIEYDPLNLTQTSPELQELNKGLTEFIRDPFAPRFVRSHLALEAFEDNMFEKAAREARAGAKIISFSEALMFTFKPVEDKTIRKARDLAIKNKLTLLLTIASFIPGEIRFGDKYVENKAIMINPCGEIESTFFKNKPVPVVEPSVAGDGTVPVYASAYGSIATSICYDADFPALIRQAGQQNAGILLLPSGDWKEISTYHGDMSRMRAVENGMSILRPVSGATSIACDRLGKVLAARSFYDNGDKVVSAYLAVNGMPTLYSILGDYFPWLCLLSLPFLIYAVVTRKRYRLFTVGVKI